MNTIWTDNLPLFLSFIFLAAGVIVSALLARIARGSSLYTFTLLVTTGAVVFGIHHVIELEVMRNKFIFSDGSEIISSLIFLAATLYLGYRLRRTIYKP